MKTIFIKVVLAFAVIFLLAADTVAVPDLSVGEFPPRDPIRPNLYTYVANNPVNKVDPLGLYEEDVHRDLTRMLAVRAGFSATDATRIAAADQGVDDNWGTSPYTGGLQARQNFHFTTQDRRNQMQQAAYNAGSMDLFGQFLHAEQDSYSHQRGLTDRNGEPYDPKLGHAMDGHAPDKPYLRPELALLMAEDTYQQIRKFYKQTHGCDVADEWKKMRPTVERFLRIRR